MSGAEGAIELLRALRTGALRLLGPGDRAWRALRGRPPLPPLWLRRHTGPLGSFESAARETEALLARLALVRAGDRVLDVGCGCGSMVPSLLRLVGERGSYVGFDVHAPSVAWCRRRFGDEPRCRFELAAVASRYAAGEAMAAVENYRFPLADAAAGFVLAKSVFTHLLEPAARHYLREMARTLQPGRAALVTTFLFDGATTTPAFPQASGDGAVRWRRAARPEAAVAYARERFEAMVGDAGLTVRELVPGFFPGRATAPRGQDTIILGR